MVLFRSDLQKYEPIGKIGEGTYGVVFKARYRDPSRKTDSTKTAENKATAASTTITPPPSTATSVEEGQEVFVAVKKFKSFKVGDGISPTAIREIKLLRELENRYIVNLLDVYLDNEEKSLYLIFDYAGHDLLEMIRWHRLASSPPMEIRTVKSLLYQILSGVNYLHKNWVIHRDLKPSNILVTGDDKPLNEKGVAKIADFGLARLYQAPLRPLSDADAVVVTIWYRAPELLLGAKHYTNAIDLWAIGCIFAEMLTSKPLFQGREEERKDHNSQIPIQADQIEKIFKILGKPSLEKWPTGKALVHWKDAMNWQDYKNRLWDAVPQLERGSKGFDLLTRLLEYDPTRRITAEQALQHPYFKEEPLPQRCVFVNNVDPYESHKAEPVDAKTLAGWLNTTNRNDAKVPKVKPAPLLSAAPPPKKKQRI